MVQFYNKQTFCNVFCDEQQSAEKKAVETVIQQYNQQCSIGSSM